MWINILGGAVSGLLWSVGGYCNKKFKNKDPKKKISFDWKMVIKPAIIGIAIGSYSAYTGNIADFSTILAELTTMFPLTAVVDRIVGIILKGFGNK